MTTAATHTPVGDPDDVIRTAGLRVTEPRRAVLLALGDRPHASADDVFQAVAGSMPSTSLQSVYNALSDFSDAGIVRRIEPAGRPGLFELRVADNHHHLICTECSAVRDVDCVVGSPPCLAPSDSHGFAVQIAEVTFWGLCPACSEAASTAGSPAHRS
jgi:Fur family transcriptional regulator, stress-responsive regulator